MQLTFILNTFQNDVNGNMIGIGSTVMTPLTVDAVTASAAGGHV